MRRFSIPLGLALAAVGLLTTVATARAEKRPFMANGSGSVTLDDHGNLIASAFGEATHLGRSYFGGRLHPIAWRNGNLLIPQAFLLAANGDVIIARVDAWYDPATGFIAGTITFNGGTGRFENATGSADLLILYDPTLGQFDYYIEGTIDF